MGLVPLGRCECKLSRRGVKARIEQTKKKRKKKEAIGEFYDTKEKQVLKDEVIMAEKKVRENEGEGISGHLE